MALNEIARHFYEKEVDNLLELEDKSIIKDRYIDMRRMIDDLYEELAERARKIEELEGELAVKEDLLEIKNGLCKEESLPFSDKECDKEPVKINLNDNIKVKLTPYGAEIYYHQYDETNKLAGRTIIEPQMPMVDEDGYTQFQLHHFVNLYGEYIRMCNENVIAPLNIILCD